MNKRYVYIFILLFCSFLLMSQNTQAQSVSKKELKQIEKFDKLKKRLENQQFSFSAKTQTIASRKIRMRQASYSFMKLNGNSISSSLLYSGKLDGAQGPEYTLDYKKSMISLASKITNYSLTYKNNENTIIVTFDTTQTGENYHLEIIVHKGESTIVKITTNKREPVIYEGNIR